VNNPLIVAHRGASTAERENTVAAFRSAARMGADMVELDVRQTADGRLIVHHDAHIEGVAIITMRADELPTYVPTLAAALDACAGMDVNVEIKNDTGDPDFDAGRDVARRVVELLRTRADHDRMLISSFDRESINLVRRLDPTLRTGFLFTLPELVNGLSLEAFLKGIADEGHVAIHPYRRVVTRELVAASHAVGLAVNVWTVDKPELLRMLADLGVDALITNVPDIAREALNPR
jgi:glycerophosphoryl diester phosphodiesterase